MRRAALCALPIAVLAVAPAPAQEGVGGATSWYGIVADDGAWIGHGSREYRDGHGGREIVEQQVLALDNEDYPDTKVSDQTVTRFDAKGRVVAIHRSRTIDRSQLRIDVEIDSGEARITRRAGTDVRSGRIALRPDVRFDNGAGLIPGWDPQRVPRLEFSSLDPDAMRLDRVTIQPAAGVTPAGAARLALRQRFDKESLVGVELLAIDAGGSVVAVIQPMFGTGVTFRAVTRAEALAPRPAYHVLRSVMVKSPYRVPDSALRAHIRYAFAFRDGIAFVPPETADQRVTVAADGVKIDICANCGPGLPTDTAYLEDARRATAMMQSDSPRIRDIAAPIAVMRVSQATKMELLLKEGAPFLARIDFNGHYSALETLSRRSGDCTEAAVLLGALGRAAGIPTKVVNGLVYSRARYHGVSNVFMPHSWVLAYVDGKWRSFDLALDTFDSTHIALSIGDGDARSIVAANQLAGLLVWQAMAEVRTAGPPAS